jgi:RhtB (resistance to homoserine/threonine) family protein
MGDKLAVIVTVTLLCMLSPGPDMVLVMRNTLTRDRVSGNFTALGVLTGNLVHIGYCVLGLATLLAQSPLVYGGLRLAGAAYLVYLGVQSLRSRAGGLDRSTTVTPSARLRSAYRQGLINNLLNAKGAVFYLGVFSQLITSGTAPHEIALLAATSVSVSAAFWLVFVQALHLPIVRGAFDRYAVAVDRIFGVMLILLGVTVALTEIG